MPHGLWGQKCDKSFNWEYIWNIGEGVMVFNTSFNSISAILWWSVLLVEQTGVPWQTLSQNVVSSTPWHDVEILEHPVYEKYVIWILEYKLNMRM